MGRDQGPRVQGAEIMRERRRLTDHCAKCNAEPGKDCRTPSGKKAQLHMVMKPVTVIKTLAKGRNLDPRDINSDVFLDRPEIAEVELSLKVQRLCKAGKFHDAAKAIETEVRLAHDLEAAL